MTSLNCSLVMGFLLISNVSLAQNMKTKAESRESLFLAEVVKQAGPEESTGRPLFEEIPDGLSSKDISPGCDPRLFEDKLLSKKISTAEYYRQIKNYFSACGNELTQRSWIGGVGSLIKTSYYQYSFLQHPQIKSFTIKLPSGTQVPAVIALKRDPRPRPLVVLKCGVFCSAAESTSMIESVISLFDQSPFNVVLLANQTGTDHIALNHIVSIGGWTEGDEVMQVGKWLKEKWEYKDRISSVHLVGLSLGGNAAVMGAAYNDMHPQADGSKVYSSVMAICPVVSLQPTLEHLFASPIIGDLFAKYTKDQFTDSRSDLTDVPDLLTEKNIPKSKYEMSDFLGLLNSTSLQRRGIASTPSSYFKNNNFWNLKQKVTTPMLVWASKDDIVVSNKLNAQVVEFDNYYQNSPTVGVVNLPYGSHCSFSAAYGFLATTTVMKTFVLAHSPEFLDYKQNQMPWSFGFKKMYPVEEHVGQVWKFAAKSDQAKVSFRIFNYTGSQCYDQGPWAGADSCISTKEYSVPISSLKNMGARIPANSTEAASLSREFNAKVEFKTKELAPLNGTNATEFTMVWRAGLN